MEGEIMSERVFQYQFNKIYQLYLQKVTKKVVRKQNSMKF